MNTTATTRGRWLALAALIMVSLAACSGSDDTANDASATTEAASPDTDTSSVDACTLLTEAQIEAAVGNSVAPGEMQALDTCQWNGSELEDVNVTLTVSTRSSDPEVVCKGSRDVSEQAGPVEEIPGLGNEAWWTYRAAGAMSNGDISVCIADGVVLLALAGERDEAQMRQAAETLVQEALAAL